MLNVSCKCTILDTPVCLVLSIWNYLLDVMVWHVMVYVMLTRGHNFPIRVSYVSLVAKLKKAHFRDQICWLTKCVKNCVNTNHFQSMVKSARSIEVGLGSKTIKLSECLVYSLVLLAFNTPKTGLSRSLKLQVFMLTHRSMQGEPNRPLRTLGWVLALSDTWRWWVINIT